MYGFKILCEISKGTFEISHKFWTHTLQNTYFTVLYFCVWVMISLNCDVISLSETGPRSATIVGDLDKVGWLFPTILYLLHDNIVFCPIYIFPIIYCVVWRRACPLRFRLIHKNNYHKVSLYQIQWETDSCYIFESVLMNYAQNHILHNCAPSSPTSNLWK